MKKLVKNLTVFSFVAVLAACSNSLSETQKNTALGVAIGAAAGHVLGESTEATLGGAALGGVIGSQIGK